MTYIPLSLLLSLSFLLYTLQKKNVSFNIRTLVGLAGGVGLGILAHVCSNNPMPLKSSMVLQLADLMGSVYLHLLQMIVIPLIFTSMIDAIMKMGDTCGTFLRRLLAGSVSMLLGLTAVSAAIGLTVGQWFNLGAGLQLPEAAMSPKHQYDGIGAAIKDMLPSNPFASMADGNTVAIVIFALLLGTIFNIPF